MLHEINSPKFHLNQLNIYFVGRNTFKSIGKLWLLLSIFSWNSCFCNCTFCRSWRFAWIGQEMWHIWVHIYLCPQIKFGVYFTKCRAPCYNCAAILADLQPWIAFKLLKRYEKYRLIYANKYFFTAWIFMKLEIDKQHLSADLSTKCGLNQSRNAEIYLCP